MSEARYAYQQQWSGERARLAGAEALWDATTQSALGCRVAPGCAALEVGAGGGTIARWLAEQAGPTGSVLAIDLDPRFLAGFASTVLEVRQSDVVTDPLPETAFDLVHARLVLEHLVQRERVLDRLIHALRPGGWLVIEDYDFTSFGWESADDLEQRASDAVVAIMSRGGFDATYGRRLVGDLTARGLREVTGSGRSWIIDAAHPGYQFFQLSFEQLASVIVAAGLLSETDVQDVRDRIASGTRLVTPTLFTTCGRR